MMSNDAMLSVVREYVRLQDVLLTKLHEITPNLAELEPWLWPQGGSVDVEGVRWTFRRHGAGVKFTSAVGIVVDAHEYITASPYPFDAFRLDRYVRSLGRGNATSPVGKRDELDQVEAVLASLRREGHLEVDPRGAERRFKAYLLT